LLLGMVLSVCTCWFHSMVTLPPWPISTNFGIYSYQWFCPIVPLFPCVYWSVHVVVRTFHHAFLCTVLLPVWGMKILYGLLSYQINGIVCICYLSVCLIPLLRNIVFVSFGIVLLLFHSQFLLLSIP
jgi:hypothetical protein